ncbi:MAG: TatD family hydrolase [Bacteroidales bacterium]|jgi:TatD DNase family protein|nr:TatD family hydrolase [Bacteroidales bacterium]MDD3010266.1 TatD family hydrolase [Bacteroidales bacterium]HPE87575.1 TatD family hydrolase [Bacteroidales bacterium]
MEYKYIDIHTHHTEVSPDCIRILNYCPGYDREHPEGSKQYFSVGVHPWYIESVKKMPGMELFSLRNVLAIGETGLDKLRGPAMDVQERWFVMHIMRSEQLSKPLILHNVKSTQKILEHYKRNKPLQPWIMHGFQGNSNAIKQFERLPVYFSFGIRALISSKTIDFFRRVDPSKIFAETDENSAAIELVYLSLAKIRETSVMELKKQVYKNFAVVFKTLH